MENLTHHPNKVSSKDKNEKFGHKSPVIWLTGLSGSGKSTIANELEAELFRRGIKTHILDGDNVRMGLNKGLGFSNEDRKENIRRVTEVSKLFSDSGTLVITAFISPFEIDRNSAKEIIGSDNFIEIYVKADLSTCEKRDPKGLYKKARNGEIKQFTGIDSPYEEPSNPSFMISTDGETVNTSVSKLIHYLEEKGIIKTKNYRENEGWGKENYGGNPTSNKDKKRAIFVGRYQPYHQGHISLIQQKLNEGIPALILVRDIEPDEKNPFTTEQTVNMIKKYHKSHGDDVEVMVIPDIESVNFGRGVGYEVNQFSPPDNIKFISATKIRESIKEGNNSWRDLVDKSIQEDVVNYLTDITV